MIKPLILVTAPVQTRSGYGNHARDICRALIESDKYDIAIQSVPWGNTPLNALEKDNPVHKEIEKRIFLQSIDLNWKSHIQYLEQLRQVIGLRSYGQRDPLVEYKKEAFDLFSNLLEKLKLDFVTILMNLKVVTEQKEENKKSMVDQIKSGKKIGRNEPCSCGSGKKFKHCCGAL